MKRVPNGIDEIGFVYNEVEPETLDWSARERIKWLKAEIKGIDEWLPKAKRPKTEFWLTRRANLQKSLDILTGKTILEPDEPPPYAENPLDLDEIKMAVRNARGALAISRQHLAEKEYLDAIQYTQMAIAEVNLLWLYGGMNFHESPVGWELMKQAKKISEQAYEMREKIDKKYRAVFFRRA